MENKKFAGYKAALGAFLVIFVNIGVCTTLGVFIAQLASYSGWSLSACVIIGTINTIVNLLLSLVAIPVAKKIGYRWTMLISILAVALHVNMYCFATPGQNVGTLICFYVGGALASVAIAFGSHAVCSGLIAEWFLDSHQREKVTGTVLSGAGFGAAIWVFLAGQLFKYFTWQQCYRIITVIALVFGLIAVLFLIRTPKEVGQLPMPANDTVTDPSKLPGVTHKAALKSGSFWLLVIGMLCSVTACSAIISYAAAYWQGLGMSATASSNWTAVYLLISSLSLLIAGAVFKKLKSSGYTLLTHICMIACFALMLVWGANSSSFIMVLLSDRRRIPEHGRARHLRAQGDRSDHRQPDDRRLRRPAHFLAADLRRARNAGRLQHPVDRLWRGVHRRHGSGHALDRNLPAQETEQACFRSQLKQQRRTMK